jgi:hypothetical protein
MVKPARPSVAAIMFLAVAPAYADAQTAVPHADESWRRGAGPAGSEAGCGYQETPIPHENATATGPSPTTRAATCRRTYHKGR